MCVTVDWKHLKNCFLAKKKKKKWGEFVHVSKNRLLVSLVSWFLKMSWDDAWSGKLEKLNNVLAGLSRKAFLVAAVIKGWCNSFATSSPSSSVLRSLFSASKTWHGQIIDTIWSAEMFRNTQLWLRQFNAQKAKFFEAEKQRLLKMPLKMLLSGCTFSVC